MKRIWEIRIITILLSLASIGSLQAQAKLSTDTILLGDQTTLSIRQDDFLPSTEQLSQNGIEALGQEYDSASNTVLTTLTSFEPGVHYIYLGPDDSLPLTVLDVEVDTASAEIRDIAPVVQVPYTFWEIFRWILLGLGVLALAFAGWWISKHWRRIEEAVGLAEPVDTRTPEERALDNLEALRRKQLWQTGQTKEYYTELTDAVRAFIEEATDIRATEMTSEECLNAIRTDCRGADTVTLLGDIFTRADLVKFAKGEPLPHEHQRTHDEAVEFVKGMWAAVNPNSGNNENTGSNE